MAKAHSKRTSKTQAHLKPPVRFGLFGASGRMGTEISTLWKSTFHEEIHSKDLRDSKSKTVHTWIDFSSPAGFSRILDFCVENRKALVSGTTGLEEQQLKDLKKAAKKIPILWAPNMSIGVNILLKSFAAFSGVKGFDFQIEEVHHRYKKDKPSGTALWIQKELQKTVGKKIQEPVALRGGGVFGIHKVWALSDEEVIVFEHSALNRRVFARGAVDAALWLHRQPPGLYSIQNMLGQE